MKQKQFTDEQIVTVLQEAEKGDKPVSVLCRKHGLSENTLYRWRNRFGGMQVIIAFAASSLGGGEAGDERAARLVSMPVK